jgi:hypothetical protein
MDAAKDEQRNNPNRCLPEPWGKSQGIWKDRARADGAPEWRWMEVWSALETEGWNLEWKGCGWTHIDDQWDTGKLVVSSG